MHHSLASRIGSLDGRSRMRSIAVVVTSSASLILVTMMGSPSSFGDDAPKKTGDEEPKAQVAATPLHDNTRSASDLTPDRRREVINPNSDAISQANQMIDQCLARYQTVKDYSCTFFKRERFDGKLSATQVMSMKARTRPLSFYFKCSTPRAGREAIWVEGQNQNKIIAHDSGFFKVLAGTMHLDPLGSIAMEDNRHPITEAGLGNMIKKIQTRWSVELRPETSSVRFAQRMMVGDRECTMIETTHRVQNGGMMFYRVRLYVDNKLGLPIRFEGYDWPKKEGSDPELVEEYTYANLRVNVGLADLDFVPSNPAYSFGRF